MGRVPYLIGHVRDLAVGADDIREVVDHEEAGATYTVETGQCLVEGRVVGRERFLYPRGQPR